MNYVSIVNLIFLVINGLFALFLFHFIFFALVGLFTNKHYPETNKKCRYGVVVSCKDEENVVERLISSIRSTDYPQDKLDIIIIAHNCKDKTAEVARSLGAIVIEDNNKNENTLGQAYHYAFKHLDNISSYDGFVFLNADNIVKKDYFTKLNDAFVYHECKETVSSFRHALNAKQGLMPSLYTFYFSLGCLMAFKGRNVFNVSARVTGCGFVVPRKDIENGWNYTSITEDVEFSADTVYNGKAIHYCNDAIFYDEQPTKISSMWHQRLRWSKGQIVNSKKYFPKFLKALFNKEKKNKFSLYVALTFNSFLVLTFSFIFMLQIVTLLFSPLAGVSLYDAFLYWDHNSSFLFNMFMSMNTGMLFILVRNTIFFFISNYFVAFIIYITGRDRFKENRGRMFLASIFFPIFLALQLPLDLVSLFKREIKWVKIPHGNN